MKPLVRSCAVLLALLVLHVLDHATRQHRPVPSELSVPGTLGIIAPALVLALALARRREAAPFAVLVGLSTALGFVAVHLLPRWGVFSDPYADAHLDVISWASMLGSLVAGLALALVGLRELRRTPRVPAVR